MYAYTHYPFYGHGCPLELFQGGAWARGDGKRRVRGCNGDLRAEPQWGPGTEPLIRGPSPLEAKSFEAFAHLKKVQKFPVDVRNLLNMALAVSRDATVTSWPTPIDNGVWGQSPQRGPVAASLLSGS